MSIVAEADNEVRERLIEQRGDALPDRDADRAYVFHSRFFTVSLIGTMGPALDPYSALDLARALDSVAVMTPLSLWTKPGMRVSMSFHSAIARPPALSIAVDLIDATADELNAVIEPAPAAVGREMRKQVEKARPRGRLSEVRIVVAMIGRRLREGDFKLR
jgi:hypothetical protein